MRGATALFGAIIVASTFTIPYNAARPHFHAQVQTERPEVPLTWDDAAMATLEVPLADPRGSPKHVPAEYYYKIPVRPIYTGVVCRNAHASQQGRCCPFLNYVHGMSPK